MGQPIPVRSISAPVRLANRYGTSRCHARTASDGKLRQRLQQREHRQRDALRKKELRGFGAPGDHQAGEQNAGTRPEHRPGAACLQ